MCFCGGAVARFKPGRVCCELFRSTGTFRKREAKPEGTCASAPIGGYNDVQGQASSSTSGCCTARHPLLHERTHRRQPERLGSNVATLRLSDSDVLCQAQI